MLVAVAVTQVEFPAFYHGLRELDGAAITLVAVRNALLAAALILAIILLWRSRGSRMMVGGLTSPGVDARRPAARAGSAQAEHPERLIHHDGGEDGGQ